MTLRSLSSIKAKIEQIKATGRLKRPDCLDLIILDMDLCKKKCQNCKMAADLIYINKIRETIKNCKNISTNIFWGSYNSYKSQFKKMGVKPI